MAAADDEDSQPEENSHDASKPSQTTNGEGNSTSPLTNGLQKGRVTQFDEGYDARFEALVKDRDALRVEVTHLRQSLEKIQANHENNLRSVREELQDTQTEKEHAEEQYQTLLGRVNTIKAQLGERLKADAVCLSLLDQSS